MTLRVLIADDEPLALDGLELTLAEFSDVDVVARCGNGSEAIRAMREHRPDVAILDIAMPGLTGFDVVESLASEPMPVIVFLTAHSEHALRAFRVDASDYLLKPVDDEDLRAAIEKARRKVALQSAATRLLPEAADETLARAGAAANRLAVRTPGRVYFLEPADISWLEACGDYVQVHCSGRTHMIRASLRKLTAELLPHGFCRVHRSATVNVRRVAEMQATDNGDYRLVLHDGTSVRLSRTYRGDLFAAMRTEDVP